MEKAATGIVQGFFAFGPVWAVVGVLFGLVFFLMWLHSKERHQWRVSEEKRSEKTDQVLEKLSEAHSQHATVLTEIKGVISMINMRGQ